MNPTGNQEPHGANPDYSPSQTSDQLKSPRQQQQYSTEYSRYRTSQRPGESQGFRPTQKQHGAQPSFIGSLAALEHILAGDISNRGDYEQRTKYAQQLDKFISDSCTSGVIQWHRQDMMQIVEICTYYSEQSLSKLLSLPDVPQVMKECLGRILANAACHTRLDLLMGWLLDRLIRPPAPNTSTEYKFWLLSILQEAIVRAQADTFTQRQLQECAPSIMTNLMLFLDTTEAIEQLEIVLLILASLAEYYSGAFVNHFQSLVDLLVGWCLAAETSDQDCDMIHNALIGFGPYWNTSMVFGFELLQHFVNDLYAQVQEMQALDESSNENEKSCHRLLSCFYCLSQAVIPLIPSLDQYHQINTLFYQLRSDTIMLFLQALGIHSLANKSWFDQCNQIMLLISSVHPITFQQLQHSMYYYFTCQLEQSFMPPLIYIGYILKMIGNSKPATINQETLHELLDITRSPLLSLLTSQPDTLVQQGIMLIFYHLFNTSLASFLHTYSTQWTTTMHPTIPTTQSLDITMPKMAQLVTTPSGTHELDPTTYCRLLLKTATAVKSKHVKNEDTGRIQSLHEDYTVYTLCKLWQVGAYDAFDTVLALLLQYWSTMTTTRENFLHDITRPGNWETLSIRSKLGLLEAMPHVNLSIMAHLVQAEAYEINPSIKEKIIRLAILYGEQSLCFQSSAHPIVRNAARDYIQAFNPLKTAYTTPTLYWEKSSPMPLLKAMIMSTPHTGDFRPIHYELVMKKLGMQHLLLSNPGDDPPDEEETWDWARRLFYSCGGTHSLENTDLYRQQIELDQSKLGILVNESGSLLFYWALWECARYCILSRLRTPFGAPQQTFAAFEKSLYALVNDDTTINSTLKTTQLHGLLILLDRLELQIYNAAEGNTTTSTTTSTPTLMPMVPKGNFTFFHTNRKTCQDYYSRIRPLMLQGAKKLIWDTFFLKHAMALLSSYEQSHFSSLETILAFFKKINPHVKDIVDTCIRHRMVDTITGLEKWYQQLVTKAQKDVPSFGEEWYFNGWIGPLSTSTKAPSWFQIAIDFAKGHDENAIADMSQLDPGLLDITQECDYARSIVDMLNKHALHFYTSLKDYDSIQSICQQHPYLFSNEISKQLVDFASTSNPPATTDLSSFLSNTDNLESLVQLGRLTAFREAVLDPEANTQLSKMVCQRLLPCFDDQPLDSLVFAQRRTNLIDLQLQYHTTIPLEEVHHGYDDDTKTWARLAAAHHRPDLLLKTAQVAQEQLNYHTASTYLDTFFAIANIPTPLKHQAMYEKINLQLATSHDHSQAFLAFNSMIRNDLSDDEQPLKTKVLLDMVRILEHDATSLADESVAWLAPSESAIATLVNKATENTMDPKPWFVYGEHCYRQAHQLIDAIGTPASKKMQQVQSTWHPIFSRHTDIHQDQYPELEKFLWQTFKATSTCDINILVEKVQAHAILGDMPGDAQADLLAPLLALQTTILTQFRAAIAALVKYLDLADGTGTMPMRAALRLVQILVQYGDALQPEFETHTITHPLAWQQIMPQLFSRLATHSSAFVKRIFGQWIGRLVDAAPHQVIYHLIVGITTATNDTQQVLYHQVDRIKAHSDHVWTTTRRMTEELERVTVLWEETWLHRISNLQLDVMNQWARIDKALPQGGLDLYKTAMQPVIRSLDDLMATTINSTLTTPHEKWFDATFGKSIRRAYDLVVTPESLESYRKGWDKFQQIHRRLTMETQKCRVFELKDISPYLANLQDETIRIPGLSSCVHLHHVGPTLTVIPTKTKPKKLDLHGTDGITYTYLFKGLEDLQLDERIMQLLATTNALLREDTAAAQRHLHARTYAVIPMSAHSGMIQWVPQATPLFGLYKNWQKRTYLNTLMLQQPTPTQQRPTEHYIEKVLQKMKATGLRATTNRRHWPTDILRSVYTDLTNETPQDLLSKALWWSSTDSLDHLNKTTRLARSMAVMSMIGYVIGLGDRHLDNIMMDDTTGDIIHIDYNVCFEKGTTLRVPERVPYRLTRNMVHALGITSVHGEFGCAAQHTLRLLRHHKAFLLGLMEDATEDEEAGKKKEQQSLGLQESLATMAEKLAKTSTWREQQHAAIMEILATARQQWTHDDQEDDESDDDDMEPYHMTSPPSDWEHDPPSSSQAQLAGHLDHILQQLNQPYETFTIHDMLPLLDSIRMMEMEENNEIHAAQQSAKIILDTLQWLETCMTRLNETPTWTGTALIDMVQETMDHLDQYYASLRMLESFGGVEPKVMARKGPLHDKRMGVMNRVRQKLQGNDQDYVSADHIMTVAEQVAKTIEQATSVQNLSLMYEGWTSWV